MAIRTSFMISLLAARSICPTADDFYAAFWLASYARTPANCFELWARRLLLGAFATCDGDVATSRRPLSGSKRHVAGRTSPFHNLSSANPPCWRPRGRPVWLSAALPVAAYLASIAVTSTSIAILGHANWLTTRNVEAGIGVLPKASARHFSAS